MIAALLAVFIVSVDAPEAGHGVPQEAGHGAPQEAGHGVPALQGALEYWGGEVYKDGRKLTREEAYRELGRDDLVEERERLEMYRWIGFGAGIAVAAVGNVARTTGTVMGFMGEADAKNGLFWGGLAAEVLVAPAIVGLSVLIPREPVSNEELKEMVRAE